MKLIPLELFRHNYGKQNSALLKFIDTINGLRVAIITNAYF
jgi:hypothetical protein